MLYENEQGVLFTDKPTSELALSQCLATRVNNERLDFGSSLRFIEGVFNIPEGALSFADARATSDLSNFFQFTQSPRSFQKIPARFDAEYFIHDKTPPEAPDND